MSFNDERWQYIDSIRGLAALGVVYYHAAERVWLRDMPFWPTESFLFLLGRDWIDVGKISVILFFAVSGFVIPFSLMKPGPRPIRQFLIGRFFRLYPAYWLSLLLGLLVLFPLEGRSATPGVILANLTMAQSLFRAPHVIELYWTLQIELLFYLIAILLFAMGWLQRHQAIVALSALMMAGALAAAAVKFWSGHYLPVALPLSLAVMFWGLSWRYRLAGGEEHRRLSNRLTLLILGLMPLVCFLGYGEGRLFAHEGLRYTLTYLIAISAFLLLTTRLKLVHPVLVHLGTISYSIYLFAPIWQISLEKAFATSMGRSLPYHLSIAVLMAVSVGMAHLIYRLVESPARRLGRRLQAATG